MLISQCVEDISRFAAGDMDLQHTTDTLINDMDGAETLGIRSFIVNNSRAIRRRLFPDLYMVDKFEYAKELQPYKGMGLCSECGRLTTSLDGRDVVVPGKWHGKFPKKKATEEQLKKVGYKNLIK